MKRRLISICLALLLMLSLLAACGTSNTPATTAPPAAPTAVPPASGSATPEAGSNGPSTGVTYESLHLVCGGTVAYDHAITQGEFFFAEKVEEASGGAITVDVFPNCELGSAREQLEAIQLGNLDMMEAGSNNIAGFTDKLKFSNLPYLFDSREAVIDFFTGPKGEELALAIAEETGIYAFAWLENGFFLLNTTVGPIETPADVKGMKFRVLQNNVYMETHSVLGMNPTPMAFTELFTALQQGVVQGQCNSSVTTYTGNFFEVAPYVSDIRYIYDITGFWISYEKWNSLDSATQELLKNIGKEMTEYQFELSKTMAVECLDLMDEMPNVYVTRFTDEELEPWKEALAPMYDWYESNYDDPSWPVFKDEIDALNAKYAS